MDYVTELRSGESWTFTLVTVTFGTLKIRDLKPEKC